MSPTTFPTLASLAPMTNNSFTCLTLPLTLVMATSNYGKGCWIKLVSFCYDITIGSRLVDYGAWSHYQKFWVLQLLHATKILLHATHATANLCSCIGHVVACDITYTTCIYGVSIHVHTYIPIQCSCTLCATFFATTYN